MAAVANETAAAAAAANETAADSAVANETAAAEVVKRPAGGAFGEWLRANRADIEAKAKEAGLTKMTDVPKKGSEMWKAMSDAEKEPWVKKYEEHKAAFEVFKNSDSYVAPERKRKHDDTPKKAATDPNAPKKPVGGAYGVFQNERRGEFAKQAAAKGETGFGAGAKIASEAWKALSAEEKAIFQQRYEEAKAKYDKDISAYRAANPSDAKSSPAKSSPAKRGRTATAKPVKSGLGGAAVSLPEDVLKAADRTGYRSQLINLAGRAEISAKGCSGEDLLNALKAANGLVNKAKNAILAGA